MNKIEEVNELIRSRRSLFFPQFDAEKTIDDEIIQNILENAAYAPSHRLTFPWYFRVFSGEGRNRLAEFQSSLYKQKADERGDFSQDKFELLKSRPLECSHVIAIGMRRDPKLSVPEIEEVSATAMAVQNMYLTASAYRLAAYWGSGGITYMEEAKPFFELKPEDKLLGFFYLAHNKMSKWPQGKARSIDGHVVWVKE
ncbi:MAG: nitroreductase [Cyclobacteriaceae bacterium]|nr:nitroreductase [Cyclobacteriaceae bacterium]MCH8514853.1 nitroreductase [Cyclobacteriaceae bacterium]